jgi:hypothetical protein
MISLRSPILIERRGRNGGREGEGREGGREGREKMQLTFLLPGTLKCNSQEQIYLSGLVNEFIILKKYLNGDLYTYIFVWKQHQPWGHWSLEPETRAVDATLGSESIKVTLSQSCSSPVLFQPLSTWAPTAGCCFVNFHSTQHEFKTLTGLNYSKCSVTIYKVGSGNKYSRRRQREEETKTTES